MRFATARRQIAAVALGVALAACQAAPLTPAGPSRPRASKAQAAAKPRPEASPATQPTATPAEHLASARPPASAAAATAAGAPATLLKPATPSRTLAGVVRIDAAYAVAMAGARIITNNGGTAVAAAGQVLANNSGNLIANNGGGLVSNNSGSLISDSGGTLVGNNGSAYRLAQAAPAAPALGTILPAAGLVLTARSLRSGEPVSLGVDAAGAPVTAVLTNATGAFELYVPDAAERLIFEARFPGEAANDRRLAYDLLPANAGAELVIDEDTAQVTHYVRDACRGTVAKFVLTDDVDQTVAIIADDAAPGLIEPLTALIREFRGVSATVGLDKAPAADVRRVASRMTDAILAHVDLDAVKLTQAYWPDWTGPEEPAIPALVDIMRRAREAATAKLTADAAFFERQPYLIGANAELAPGEPPYAIRKPADLNDFLVQAFVIPNKHHRETEAIFTSIGVEAAQSLRLYTAVNNYIGVIAMTLFADSEGAKSEALAVLRGYRPGSPP